MKTSSGASVPLSRLSNGTASCPSGPCYARRHSQQGSSWNRVGYRLRRTSSMKSEDCRNLRTTDFAAEFSRGLTDPDVQAPPDVTGPAVRGANGERESARKG